MHPAGLLLARPGPRLVGLSGSSPLGTWRRRCAPAATALCSPAAAPALARPAWRQHGICARASRWGTTLTGGLAHVVSCAVCHTPWFHAGRDSSAKASQAEGAASGLAFGACCPASGGKGTYSGRELARGGDDVTHSCSPRSGTEAPRCVGSACTGRPAAGHSPLGLLTGDAHVQLCLPHVPHAVLVRAPTPTLAGERAALLAVCLDSPHGGRGVGLGGWWGHAPLVCLSTRTASRHTLACGPAPGALTPAPRVGGAGAGAELALARPRALIPSHGGYLRPPAATRTRGRAALWLPRTRVAAPAPRSGRRGCGLKRVCVPWQKWWRSRYFQPPVHGTCTRHRRAAGQPPAASVLHCALVADVCSPDRPSSCLRWPLRPAARLWAPTAPPTATPPPPPPPPRP